MVCLSRSTLIIVEPYTKYFDPHKFMKMSKNPTQFFFYPFCKYYPRLNFYVFATINMDCIG